MFAQLREYLVLDSDFVLFRSSEAFKTKQALLLSLYFLALVISWLLEFYLLVRHGTFQIEICDRNVISGENAIIGGSYVHIDALVVKTVFSHFGLFDRRGDYSILGFDFDGRSKQVHI